MTHGADIVATVSYGVGVLGVAGFVFSFLRYSNYRETVNLQNDNIKALQDTVTRLESDLEKSHKNQTENMRSISHLEGQVATYKELPLRELADGINEVSASNKQILEVLTNSALIESNKSQTTEITTHKVIDKKVK